jgi:hypothetical protein
MKTICIIIATFTSIVCTAQSSAEAIVKGGELILSGISILKVAKSVPKSNSKTVESICVKNKLTEKIIFKLSGTDQEQNEIKKELVIPKDGRECLLEVPKGIYTYEITKSNNEVYKKGEYKLDEQITIIVKDQ